ncbi:hypothetical protein DSLPV1_213 [Dishui lake phycodnavirus 1]|uniref:hypothetical protein n=1 Tax=Dishui lake phycodnavirus 1 TaxID=2079134 RepID=UPI000CD699ED|nr:hypothetical protein C5Y57_gp185 [Dishui lake phycodnavirus 1]AUT19184.1 hypothetical protein DSLPV1_213 [Dishui lake phycodnavirus 1]
MTDYGWYGDENQCRLRIGTHVDGWHRGNVENLPAYHQDVEYVKKPNLSEEDSAKADELLNQISKFRYVRLTQTIHSPANTPLNLHEVQVVVSGQDVARNKLVSASSQYAGYEASRLVNGSGRNGHDSMAHTNSGTNNQWFVIDLGEDYEFKKLDYVKILNRKDCCSDRIRGLCIYLQDAKGDTIWVSPIVRGSLDVLYYRWHFTFSTKNKMGSDTYRNWSIKKKVSTVLDANYKNRHFDHYRLHDGGFDKQVGRDRQYIGNDDIDILEMNGDCSDVLWMYSDHGVYNSGGLVSDPEAGTTYEKFSTTDGSIVPVNKGYNKLNSWDHYPQHGHFFNQISHVWAKPVPKDKYHTDMEVHGLIRSGHATIVQDGTNQTQALFDDPKFMKQDARTTLRCSTKHHHPHTECPDKIVGEPCPGGKMHWVHSQKVRCYYINEQEINTLKSNLNGAQPGDPRISMYERIKSEFCADSENLEKVIDGQKCKNWGNADQLTRQYCSANNFAKLKAGDSACTRTGMPNEDLFETIAGEFCDANPTDSWCKCYNQLHDVCTTNADAAGCAEVNAQISDLTSAIKSDDGAGAIARREIENRRHCWARVCSNDRDAFVPRERGDCSLDMCIQELQTGGHLVDSDVEMNCEINENNDPAAFEKGLKDGEKSGKLPDYGGRSGDEDSGGGWGGSNIGGGKNSTVFLGAAGGLVSCSCMCMLVLAMTMS